MTPLLQDSPQTYDSKGLSPERDLASEARREVEIIHISFAGPEFWLSADKQYHFEDHHYCGPVVLGKGGDPLESQPPERSVFWAHVNAWYHQGKRFKTVGDKNWCVYETDMQALRRIGREATPEPLPTDAQVAAQDSMFGVLPEVKR